MILRTRTAVSLFALCAAAAIAPAAHAGMFITEWMYNSTVKNQEFVEFTNLGTTPVDMTGWSYDDSTRLPGSEDLSAFGIVQPGESVIFTEQFADDFRTAWSLPQSVKIIGGSVNNLGRDDEVNLYDANMAQVDQLTYGDDLFAPGTIRTTMISGNPNPALWQTALGANQVANWVLSAVGDVYGSYTSANGDIGNPGIFTPPTTVAGDFDADGDVDGADFVAWQTHYPTTDGSATLATGDANGDHNTDGADFALWQTNFPNPTSTVTAVPEPQTWLLLTAALAAFPFITRRINLAPGTGSRHR